MVRMRNKQQKKNQYIYSLVLLIMAFLAAVLTVIFTELRWDYAAFSAAISTFVLAGGGAVSLLNYRS